MLQQCWCTLGCYGCTWSCTTQMCICDHDHLLVSSQASDSLFGVIFALSKLLGSTREWHHQHCSSNDPWSGLVTPQCSHAENSPISHHSHVGMHYTVQQKYLYFPGWLWWFLMPLTLNHVLFYYLRKTPNSCHAGTTTHYGLASATSLAVMASLVSYALKTLLWLLWDTSLFYIFLCYECEAGLKSLCRVPLCWWPQWAGTTPTR